MMGIHYAGEGDVAGQIDHTVGRNASKLRVGADLCAEVIAHKEGAIPDLAPSVVEGGE
jgi:hypothetical protein